MFVSKLEIKKKLLKCKFGILGNKCTYVLLYPTGCWSMEARVDYNRLITLRICMFLLYRCECCPINWGHCKFYRSTNFRQNYSKYIFCIFGVFRKYILEIRLNKHHIRSIAYVRNVSFWSLTKKSTCMVRVVKASEGQETTIVTTLDHFDESRHDWSFQPALRVSYEVT